MTAARLLAAAAALLAAIGAVEAAPASIPGTVLWVVDGDTYQIRHAGAPEGEPVRARHFNTPEKGDHAECDEEREKAVRAGAFVRRLLPRGSIVVLSDFGRDRYGRLLATVTLPDGRDLASLVIAAGLARPYEGGRRPSWCLGVNDGEAKGLSAPSAGNGQAPGFARRQGAALPQKSAAQIASRPSGFGRYPRHPLTLALATPDSTTRKRCAAQEGWSSVRGGPEDLP